MPVITTRTDLTESRKTTGIKTGLIWLLDNGVGIKESNVTGNTAATAVSGRALDGADRTVARLDVRAINSRVNEVA